jgi:hypothetical protein
VDPEPVDEDALGVTVTVDDAVPVPAELVAVTEQL